MREVFLSCSRTFAQLKRENKKKISASNGCVVWRNMILREHGSRKNRMGALSTA
jgi:hypothetical protein